MWLAALPEHPLSVREQRAILHPLQLCTVTFSGPRPEDFDWVVSCFDNLHFKYSIHSIVQGMKKKTNPYLSLLNIAVGGGELSSRFQWRSRRCGWCNRLRK